METCLNDLLAGWDSQLAGKPCHTADSQQTAVCRLYLEDGEDYLELARALSRQRRFREAAEAYTNALRFFPTDRWCFLARALQYMCTLRPALARTDFLRCLELGGDLTDVLFYLGVCDYLLGEYELAAKRLQTALPLCEGERKKAVIYWHTLSCCRSGRRLTLLEQYDGPNGCGTIYDRVLQLFLENERDHVLLPALEKTSMPDSEYVTGLYGCCVYWQCHSLQRKQRLWMPRLLERDKSWPDIAYLAAWNDWRRSGAFQSGIASTVQEGGSGPRPGGWRSAVSPCHLIEEQSYISSTP